MMRWMKKSCKWVWFLALIVLFALPTQVPASGQGVFQLAVLPTDQQLPLGTDFVLEVMIANGVNLNAFDVTVIYDSEVLSLLEWAHGDYFSNLAMVSEVNQPGSLRLAATQLASAPVSGGGVLLELSFNAKSLGFSGVEIANAQFSDAGSQSVEPEIVNGGVSVVIAPTYTGTPTVTRTSTPTRTVTSTPTPTLTMTPSQTPTGTNTFTALPSAASIATSTIAPSSIPGQQDPLFPTFTHPSSGRIETLTLTVSPDEAIEGQSTPGSQVAQDDQSHPGEVQEQGTDAWKKGLLWGTLIVGAIALAGMFGVIIWRKRKPDEEEDLLL